MIGLCKDLGGSTFSPINLTREESTDRMIAQMKVGYVTYKTLQPD